MRQMSFSANWPQLLDGSKDGTRRLGWGNLKPGDRIQAVQKGQGLKKGEHVVTGPVIQCVSNTPERVDCIIMEPGRSIGGRSEVAREGFPDKTPEEFVKMFCKMNNCHHDTIINRIEFYDESEETYPPIS